LVTKGTLEPYRMFTSRAEYRLVLREDNADLRLMDKGCKLGLIDEESFGKFSRKKKMIEDEKTRIRQKKVQPNPEVQQWLRKLGTSSLNKTVSLWELMQRPEIDYNAFSEMGFVPHNLPADVREQVEIQIKYEGYIKRQQQMIDRFKQLEETKIPTYVKYNEVPGLSTEVKEKLKKVRPLSLGQASRISGITPAAISIMLVYLRKIKCLQ
jgi:tRNA uridine 5-carboxymethylaminomethyl modification enzyme